MAKLCSELSPETRVFPRIVVVPPTHGSGKVFVTKAGVRGSAGTEATRCNQALSPQGVPVPRQPSHPLQPISGLSRSTACSSEFQELWDEARAGKAFSVMIGSVASLQVAKASASGACSSTASFHISSASASLFNEVSISGFAATVNQKEICLSAGTFQLPASWKLSLLKLGAQSFCILLPLSAAAPQAGILGTLGFKGFPLLRYGGIAGGTTTLKFAGQLLTVSASAAGPNHFAASLGGSIATDGAYKLAVSLGGALLAGATGTLTGTLIGTAKTFTYSLKGVVHTPVQLTGAVTVTALSATLTSSSALLSFVGQAAFGTSSSRASVDIHGSAVDAADWSLSVSSVPDASPWTPLKNLHLQPALSGTLKDVKGAVTFHLSAAGTISKPLASWSPTPKVAVSVVSIEVSNLVGGGECAGFNKGDAWLSIAGSVSIAGFSLAESACVDLATEAWRLKASSADETISSAVVLTNMQVTMGQTKPSASVTLDGSATAAVTAGGTHSFTVKLALANGAFVIGGTTDLSGWGVGGSTLTGFAAWASAPVTAFNTGNPLIGNGGIVALPAGLSAQAIYKLSQATANLLTKSLHFTLPAGDTLTVMASLRSSSSFTFTASLAPPSSFPLLALPGGVKLGATSVTFSKGSIAITSGATIQGGVAAAHLALSIQSDGSFTGTGSVTNLSVLGTRINLVGSVSGTSGGSISAEVSATIPGPILVAPGLGLINLHLTLGTAGLQVSGTADIGPSSNHVALSIKGTLTDLQNWTLKIATVGPIVWRPSPAFSLDVVLNGTISSINGKVTFSVSASPGPGAASLGTLIAGPVTVSLSSLGAGDTTTPPAGFGCPTNGDLWLQVAGSASLTLPLRSYAISPSGCFDLTNGDVSVNLGAAGDSYSDHIWNLSVDLSTLEISGNLNTSLAVSGQVAIQVTTPTFGTISGNVEISVDDQGNIVVGGSITLPTALSIGADTEIWYTNQAVSNFNTGDPTYGTISLPEGLTILEAYTLSSSAQKILQNLGLPVPTGSSLVVMGTLNPSQGTLTLKMLVSLGSGVTIFNTNGDSLVLDSVFLEATISKVDITLSLGVTATLDLAPMVSGDQPSSLMLNGAITLNLVDLSVAVSLGFTGTWNQALGIPGLQMTAGEIQGGISADLVPSLGFAATITRFPTVIDDVTGIQPGAIVKVSINFDVDEPLVSVSISGTGGVVLEPLQIAGPAAAPLIQVYTASLYISPNGATIGNIVYPPGFSLDFVANVINTPVTVAASIDPNGPSMSFKGTIGAFSPAPGLNFGGATLGFAASASGFTLSAGGSISDSTTGFDFDALLALSTSGWNIAASFTVGDPSFVELFGSLAGSANSSGFSVVGVGTLSLAGYQAVDATFSFGTSVPFQVGFSIIGLGSVTVELSTSGFTLDFYVSGSGSGFVGNTDYGAGGSISGSVDFHLSTSSGTSFSWSVAVSAYVYLFGQKYGVASFGANGTWTIQQNQICVTISLTIDLVLKSYTVSEDVCMPWTFSGQSPPRSRGAPG